MISKQRMHRHGSHISSLDGIRGLAILMVLIAHFNGEALIIQYAPFVGPIINKIILMGLKGVELFFVLSGFLITRILLSTKEANGYFKNFYFRRFFRIFPLYYFSLAAVLFGLPYLVEFDRGATLIQKNQWLLWSYLSNIPSDISFDASSLFKLGHFWSLAVEEHFYLFWPIVVFMVSRNVLKNICIGWVVTSFSCLILGEIGWADTPAILSWSTVTHSGAIALGALCAVMCMSDREWLKLSYLSNIGIYIFGFFFLLISFVPRSFHGEIIYSLTIPICSFFFASLLVRTLNSDFLDRLFSNQVLRLFGKISYGLYVYHGILRPLFVHLFPREVLIDGTGSPFLGIILYFVLSIGCSMIISLISWYFFEKQILMLKKYYRYSLN